MALYALEDDIPISAFEAESYKSYQCCGCRQRVRVRRGKNIRTPHFYHLRSSPSCRLYSKSQDHLIAQLSIQNLLPKGEATIEKPFFKILRVADVVWEPKKIIFEIQCSLIDQKEAEKRIEEYGMYGYQIVWVLDDRIFNKKNLNKAESFLRNRGCYFAKLRKQPLPVFYDQFEILIGNRRVKKGPKLKIHPQCLFRLSNKNFLIDEEKYPQQVIKRSKNIPFYFKGDLLYLACLSNKFAKISISMKNLIFLEKFYHSNRYPIFHKIKNINEFFFNILHYLLDLLLKRS